MKIAKADIRDIFLACGFKGAAKWEAERFQQKLKDLPGSIEEGFALDDAKLDAKLRKLIDAIEAETEVTIGDDGGSAKSKPAADKSEKSKPAKAAKKKPAKAEEEEEEEEAEEAEEDEEEEEEEEEKPAKATKKPTAKKPTAKKPTAKKPAAKADKADKKKSKTDVARDRFGNRVGTGASVINSCIGKKPKTVAAIAEEAEQTATRTRAHLKWLEERDFVVEADGKYKATGNVAE